MPEHTDYPYAATMDEVLQIAIHHLEEVRHASDYQRQGIHLKMASMALRSAMLMHVTWVQSQRKGKPNELSN